MLAAFHRLVFLVLVQLLFVRCESSRQEDIVHIPDPYFLEALVELGVDEDGDGQISYPEAESTLSILLHPSSISDLSGLEAFINLDTLTIRINPLNALDISANTSLRYLECTACELAELDLSGNPKLEVLYCHENRISSLDLSLNNKLAVLSCGRNLIQHLDVSSNTSLVKLMCNNNLLTTFEVSGNLKLDKLITCGNQLSKLDISANRELTLIGVDNMSTITEVCVWTMPFPPEGVVVLRDFSPHVIFTTSCTK